MAETILAVILGVITTCLALLTLGAAFGESKCGHYGSGALLFVVCCFMSLVSYMFYVGAVKEYDEYQQEILDPNYAKEKVYRLFCTTDGKVSFVSAYGDGYRSREATVYKLPDGKAYVMRPGETCGWQFSYR